MHPPVIVLGYSEAAMLLRTPHDIDVRAIIAIHGQREYPVETGGVPHALVLEFDDAEAPHPGDPEHAARLRIRQRQAAEFGLRLSPPTIEHARQIIEFAESIRAMDGVLLCQCLAGVSRSAAAALLCLSQWTGPGREDDCVKLLLAVRPCASPHPDLVRFGDECLARQGRLVTAMERGLDFC